MPQLVLSIEKHETILLSGGITIKKIRTRGKKTMLAFDAPAAVRIVRGTIATLADRVALGHPALPPETLAPPPPKLTKPNKNQPSGTATVRPSEQGTLDPVGPGGS